MDSVDKYVKQCKDNPLLCVIVGLLLLVVTQNCIMDIGLGEWLSIEAFSNITGEDLNESIQGAQPFGQNEGQMAVGDLSRTPSTCYPQQALKPEDLLPVQEGKAIQEFNTAQPVGEGILQGVNLLDAGSHIGINSVGQSLRNANRQLRSEPPNPQVNVSPWMNTTISPDLPRRPLEVGESCAVGA